MKEKPVLPLLVSMALPMVISMFVNSLYNIVDSLFVARISEQTMTALSLVHPVQNLINAVAIGYGAGINVLIASYSGAGDRVSVDTVAIQGFLSAAIHGVSITVGSISIMPAPLHMFTSDEGVIELGIQYSTIVLMLSLVIMIGPSFEKMFQSVDRTGMTMISILCGCISNTILDPLLVFGTGFFPEMGIAGAAWATGIGQVITLTVYVFMYLAHPIPVRIRRNYLKSNRSMDLKLYSIGIPATLNLALLSLLVSSLNGILALHSQSYAVILGIYYKLQTFFYLPANGTVQGMHLIIGYNYGAGEHRRIRRIHDMTLCMSCVIMALGTVLCLTVSKQLTSLFASNPETVLSGQGAFRIISAGFIVSSVSVMSLGALEGLGKGTQSFIISLFRYVVIIIPAAFILCRIWGSAGVWSTSWITEFITVAISAVVYRLPIGLKQTNQNKD